MVNSLFQWALAGLMAVVHPLYISMVDIQHKPNEKLVEVSVRVFTDDLEKTLLKTGRSVDLDKGDRKLNDRLIGAYISKNLRLKIDGRDAAMQYLGYEQQRDTTWCYFEIRNIPTLKSIGVFCSILYDYQSIEMNIIHVKANGVDKSYKLGHPKTTTSFDLRAD